ncbi:MAG: methionyl-tRNA formyltransferase [Chloroflexi bacterium]|nr:methionyl-tRNA formyltransferase [Chloroflexota bacterium]
MNIVFIGTPIFAIPSLRRLVDDGWDISSVVTQPDRPAGRGRKLRASPVAHVASELGLSVLQPPTLRDAEAVTQIAALQPEAIVTVAYGQILRQEVLDIPPKGVLNIHPSLLPRWRGASPVPAAILNGDETTGVTIMLMDAGMDTGDILSQTEYRIEDSHTAGALLEELSTVGAELLSQTLNQWLNGEITAQPQDDADATTCPLLRKEDGAIDWSLPAVDIWRRVRAYNPWPGAFTTLNGESLRIWQTWPLTFRTQAEPGIAIAIDAHLRESLPDSAIEAAFAIHTGDGLLAVMEAQRSGRRSLPSADLLHGLPGLVGSRLGATQ